MIVLVPITADLTGLIKNIYINTINTCIRMLFYNIIYPRKMVTKIPTLKFYYIENF